MTWHQWHQTVPRSSSTKRPSLLALANTSSDHGCHSILPGSAKVLVNGSSVKASRIERPHCLMILCPFVGKAFQPKNRTEVPTSVLVARRSRTSRVRTRARSAQPAETEMDQPSRTYPSY